MSSIPDTGSSTASGSTSESILHTGEGPPLILVFLASGLFVGAVLSILALRRLYPSLRFVQPAPRPQPPEGFFRQKPQIWDTSLRPPNIGVSAGCRASSRDRWHAPPGKWQDMMPLAAQFLPPSYLSGESTLAQELTTHPDATSPVGAPSDCPRRLLFARLLDYGRPREITEGSQPALSDPETAEPQRGQLQVAIVISMPSPSTLQSSCMEKTRSSYSEDGVLTAQGPPWDYSIGMATVPDVLTLPNTDDHGEQGLG